MTGVILIMRMIENYSALILRNTDHQLMSLARSVDRSVDSHFLRYIENIEHTMNHKECLEAEKVWLTEGSAAEDGLRQQLKESLLGKDVTIQDILIQGQNGNFLSQSREWNSRMTTESKTEAEITIFTYHVPWQYQWNNR